MKNHVKVASLTAAALLLLTPQARGQTFFNNVCSPGSFKVCASAKAFVDVNGDLVIQVWNMNQATTNAFDAVAAYNTASGGHHTIFEIGLDNLGPIAAGPNGLTVLYTVGTSTTTLNQWALGSKSLQLAIGANAERGHTLGIVGCYDPDAFDGKLNQSHMQTCASGGNPGFIEFRLSGLTSINLSNALFAFHSSQVADPNCVVTTQNPAPDCLISASLKGRGANGQIAGGGTAQITPEPVTLLLVGTGAAGIAAMARRRRRK